MKKALVILISMVLVMTTGVFADSKIPDALTHYPRNYTADYTVSLVFENSGDIVALIEELEMPEEFNYFVDMKTLLKSLLTYDGKIKLQVDYSEDYTKMKIGITADSTQKININPNLKVGLDAKTGIWMDIDLSNAENPVFDTTVSLPVMNKYFHLDIGELLDEQTVTLFKGFFNKEYIDALSKSAMNVMSKYIRIENTDTGYTMSMDNEGLISFADEYMKVYQTMLNDLFGENASGMYSEFPSMEGWQLLGEDGIKYDYTVENGVVTAGEIKTDISIDVSKIYTAITGEEWIYASSGKIDLMLSETVNLSKIESTVVDFPVLTEENSISLNAMMAEDMSYETETVVAPVYPSYYVFGYCNALPVIDGEIYVPLRMTLEDAYEDSAVIEYNNGVVTVSSEYFPGFKNMTMTIGTDKVYTDGTEHTIGNIMLVNDSTYVNSKLFCDIFGWELGYASYDLLTGEYSYDFYTNSDW